MNTFFLSTIVILQLIIVFPVSFFIYNVILNISYFASVHILSVFVLLGIGADDGRRSTSTITITLVVAIPSLHDPLYIPAAFVYVDAWNQSIVLHPECEKNLEKRVAFTYRRASKVL